MLAWWRISLRHIKKTSKLYFSAKRSASSNSSLLSSKLNQASSFSLNMSSAGFLVSSLMAHLNPVGDLDDLPHGEDLTVPGHFQPIIIQLLDLQPSSGAKVRKNRKDIGLG